MQQRALADPRCADNSEAFTFSQVEIHAPQDMDLVAPLVKRFAQVADGEKITHSG